MTNKIGFCFKLAIFALSACAVLATMFAPAAYGDDCCAPISVQGADFGDVFAGEGTELEPFLIGTTQDLINLASVVNEGNTAAGLFFRMTRDVDISSVAWVPIGRDQNNVFSGNFDGDGHKITGLNIPASMGLQYAGLFGVVSNAVFRNLTVEIDETGINIYPAAIVYAGGIAAHGTNVEIINCHVSGNISVDYIENPTGYRGARAGGIVGYAEGLYLSSSSFAGEVKSSSVFSSNLGGLAGY